MIMRRKSRYVLVRSTRPISFDAKELEHQFLNEIERFMGISTYSSSHPKIANQAGGNMFIVKMNRGSESQFIFATSFIKKIGNIEVGFQTIKTSGSISTLKKLVAKC